jgi:hypothetical protein
MRSKLVIVPAVLALVACKGKPESSEKAAVKPPPPKSAPAVQPAVGLPSHFPLPDVPGKKLVRSSSRLTMVVWEYELGKLAPAEALAKIEAGMRAAAYNVEGTQQEGDTRHLLASFDGRQYAVLAAAREGITTLAIRSFPEAGPTTLPAPSSYPTTFPFLAGGTASHAPDGAKLQVAYQSDATDIELAMLLAAKSAGWQCTGTGTVTCTKDRANVSFQTEAVPNGSLLVVSSR